MPHPIQAAAPLPADPAEATAEQMWKHEAARALYVSTLLSHAPHEELSQHVANFLGAFAAAHYLRALAAVDQGAADVASRRFHEMTADGGGEWIWQWLTEAGIDPGPLQAAAEKDGRERARRRAEGAAEAGRPRQSR